MCRSVRTVWIGIWSRNYLSDTGGNEVKWAGVADWMFSNQCEERGEKK